MLLTIHRDSKGKVLISSRIYCTNLHVIEALFEGFLDVYELGMYEFESSESLVTYFLDLCG